MDSFQEEIRTNQQKMNANQERMEATVEASSTRFDVLREIKWTSQEKMKTRIGTLVSQMDIHQSETEATQEEMKAKMNTNQEKMKASFSSGQEEMKVAISCIRAELEETMKHRVEGVLMPLDRRTLGLRQKLNRKIKQLRCPSTTGSRSRHKRRRLWSRPCRMDSRLRGQKSRTISTRH